MDRNVRKNNNAKKMGIKIITPISKKQKTVMVTKFLKKYTPY